MSKSACPKCDAMTIVPGASKCPACRQWLHARPGLPISIIGLVGLVCLLLVGGGVLGASATFLWTANLRSASQDRPASPGSTSTATASSGPSSSASTLPTASVAPTKAGAPVAPISFGEPRLLKLNVTPVDVAISDDGNRIYALGQDGTVRVIAVDTGQEEQRIVLPGRANQIRMMGGRYLAALGIAGPLPILDLTRSSVTKLDVGGSVVGVEAFDEGRVLVAASAEGEKAVRFVEQRGPSKTSPTVWKVDGQIPLTRPVFALSALPDKPPMLAIFSQPIKSGELGSIDLLDPLAKYFGATKLSFFVAIDPTATAVAAGKKILVVDRSATQLLVVAPDQPIDVVRMESQVDAEKVEGRGRVVLGAYRLHGLYIVIVDAAGSAVVVSEADRSIVTMLSLGAVPSDAAATPDGQAILVALGGGPRGRGSETAVISGSPPTITRLSTGEGSRAVSIANNGKRAVVAVAAAKSVAVTDRR